MICLVYSSLFLRNETTPSSACIVARTSFTKVARDAGPKEKSFKLAALSVLFLIGCVKWITGGGA